LDMTQVNRIVVKVGTSTLAHSTGMLNIRRVEKLVKVLSDLKNAGKEVILVSSGSIGVGSGKLGLKERPKDIPSKQACAAIGQCELMYIYDKLFGEYNHVVSQVLLTKDIIDHDNRERNVINTLSALLSMNVIPIVNENDTVSTDEIEFGDNDTLSAIVSILVNADLLVVLTDIDGLYDSNPSENPDAKLIPRVDTITEDIKRIAGGRGSSLGTGGMITKIQAAELATGRHIPMYIINGQNPDQIYDLFDGEQVGTYFPAPKKEEYI
jgi:glutamate 5-kinase